VNVEIRVLFLDPGKTGNVTI